jgi:Undecaprenyl-phosphate glucose phosphotransferase
MSQAALRLVGAGLEQAGPDTTDPETTDLTTREAQRLAELAGAFCLFGLDIALDASQIAEPADQAYRVAAADAPAPANDAEVRAGTRFAFPELARRGARLHPSLPVRAIQTLDWLLVLVAVEFAARWGAGVGVLDLSLGAAIAILAAAASLKFGLWMTDAYRVSPSRMRAERGIGGLAIGVIVGLGVSAAFAPDARAAAALSATLPFTAMLLAGVHAVVAVLTRAAHRAGVFSETIVLVGATDAAERVAARVNKSGDARVVAVVDDRLSRVPDTVGAAPVAGNVDDLLAWEGLAHVDRIVITVTQKAEARVREIIRRLRVAPNRVDLLLDVDTFAVRGRGVDRFGGAALACVSGRPHNHARAFLKRVEDIALASLLLALSALPMLAIALAIKLDSPGPVFYRQRRHGFNNGVITLWKFRSMRHDPDAPLQQVRANDPRITRIGHVLRRTSLDELPQLFNVLKGDMSLVGPRPHAVGMKTGERELQDIVAEYAHRHRVKPGITGWAQVNGSRGPLETPAAVRRRVRYDLDYVARASLWLDLKILLRTIPVLLGDRETTR